MPTYSGIQKEETLKGLVHDDYFPQFGYEPNIDNIDFVITDKKTQCKAVRLYFPTIVCGSTEETIQALPPIVEPRPITA